MIGFRSVDINDNDVFALDVLAEVLGGGKASRFYRNIKEQKGLAYSISASNGSYKEDGIFYINANYTPINAEKIEKAIFDEIAHIQKYGITEEELNTAKKMIEQDTYYSRESTSNISSELGYIYTLTNSSELYENYIDNIKKVSSADVKRAAQRFLGENKSAISIALPKKIENIEKKAEVQHTAQKISESKTTTKYLIDNNATLLVHNHKNNDIIAMSIIAKGGEFLENANGEGTLVAEVMRKGTKKYSSQELAQLMEENGIKIEPASSEDSFIINVQTTTAQIDLTLEILDELFNNALFDDYEIEKKRTEILNKIKQRRDVPMNIALEEFKTLIFENSVYSHSNKVLEKNLPSVSRENVLNYYNKILDPKNIIISVNGNVDSEKLIQSFGKIFVNKQQPVFNYSNFKIT